MGQEATFKLRLKDGEERRVIEKYSRWQEESVKRPKVEKKNKGSSVTSESRVLGSVSSLGAKGLASSI